MFQIIGASDNIYISKSKRRFHRCIKLGENGFRFFPLSKGRERCSKKKHRIKKNGKDTKKEKYLRQHCRILFTLNTQKKHRNNVIIAFFFLCL